MKIQKASEDYLEAMLMMKERHGFIRSIDVAEHLGVTKPSVSYSTKRLRENGYITMDADGLITLTESGMEIAQRIYKRHKLLTEVLVSIGVDAQTALEDACRIEHDISETTFAAVCRYADKKRNGRGTENEAPEKPAP
ncbi:MAG TPA: metal-dependent transcriptional regulator [Oscillospiraceae bacterium]|nr:metal-dependent transcriptional regulator [Oscillospiraceae bacterium]